MFPSGRMCCHCESSTITHRVTGTHRSWLADGRQTHITCHLPRQVAIPLHPSQRLIQFARWIRAMIGTEHVRTLHTRSPARSCDSCPATKGSRRPVRAPAHASATGGSRDRPTTSNPPDPATAGPSKSTRSSYTRRYRTWRATRRCPHITTGVNYPDTIEPDLNRACWLDVWACGPTHFFQDGVTTTVTVWERPLRIPFLSGSNRSR